MGYSIIITANGKGSRMKAVSPKPKFSLFVGEKRIIEILLERFPTASVLTHYEIPYIDQKRIIKCEKTKTRLETIQQLNVKAALIIDCDIIIDNDEHPIWDSGRDAIFVKEKENKMINAGLYYSSDISTIKEKNGGLLLQRNAQVKYCETSHLGTPKEYYDYISRL